MTVVGSIRRDMRVPINGPTPHPNSSTLGWATRNGIIASGVNARVESHNVWRSGNRSTEPRAVSAHPVLEDREAMHKYRKFGSCIRHKMLRDSSLVAGKSMSRISRLVEVKTDRKSTRLNSSHQIISYAVFCLK